jgi:porphobilinogen synthase
MIISAVEKGLANKRDIVFESMVCFKRAGADGIFTYFAPYLLNHLGKGI